MIFDRSGRNARLGHISPVRETPRDLAARLAAERRASRSHLGTLVDNLRSGEGGDDPMLKNLREAWADLGRRVSATSQALKEPISYHLSAKPTTSGITFTLGSFDRLAPIFEKGAKPHAIAPRRADHLSIGGSVLAKGQTVFHPGFSGRHTLGDGMRAARADLLAAAKSGMVEAVKQGFAKR